MQIGAIIAILGTTLQTAAMNVGTLIAGRLIAGLAIGIIYFAIPMYQSEIAPPEHRFAFPRALDIIPPAFIADRRTVGALLDSMHSSLALGMHFPTGLGSGCHMPKANLQ